MLAHPCSFLRSLLPLSALCAAVLASPIARAEAAAPASASADKPSATTSHKATPGSPHARRMLPMRTARVVKPEADQGKPRKCLKMPVEVTTGAESATFALAKCDGGAAPLGVVELSILARPPSAPKPKEPLEALDKKTGDDVAPGVRRLDSRLLERLELAVDRFRKDSKDAPARVILVSGYRPRSAHSYHQLGRALDFRIDGVTNEALVAFCKTLPDTGCGYYPNSLFVHMDVRNARTGHITWIDISGPGEAPKYVSQWPLPSTAPATGSSSPRPLAQLARLPEPREQDMDAGEHPRVRSSQHPYFF
jgi:hypothetical protein